MPSRIPPKPQVLDAHSAEHALFILPRLTGETPMIRVEAPLILEIVDSVYVIKLAKQSSTPDVGFQGEYNPAKKYFSGQWFKISSGNPFISGTTIKAGQYAVRANTSTADALGYAPFAGFLPAQPLTAGINSKLAFFDPDNSGAPAFSSAPNDRIYAEIINQFC